MAEQVAYNGKMYRSMHALCKELNLNYSTFISSIKHKKLTVDEAVEHITTKINYNGKSYPTYKELCAAHKINYSTFLSRRSRGMSIDEALSKEISEASNCKPIRYNGVLYKSRLELCEANHCSYSTFMSRYTAGLPISVCLYKSEMR